MAKPSIEFALGTAILCKYKACSQLFMAFSKNYQLRKIGQVNGSEIPAIGGSTSQCDGIGFKHIRV